MNKKALSQEVNVSKNIFLLFIFSITTYITYFNVVAVSIKEYKKTGEELKKYSLVVNKAQNTYDITHNHLVKFKKQNKKILKASINEYTALEIGKYLQANFLTFDIKSNKESTLKSEFRFIELDISVITDSVSNFYRFMEQINSSRNIIKLSFPLKFNSKGKSIDIRFKLKIYTFNRFTL